MVSSYRVTPGSDEAVAIGCTCPRMDNEYGDEKLTGGWWTTSQDCPLHGWELEDEKPEN